MNPQEEELLRAVKYDSQLMAVHPLVASNVLRAVETLLAHLGRADLAEALATM